MKASLDDSTEAFLGKTLSVDPFHGYGWTEAYAEREEFSHRDIPPPASFVIRLERLWGNKDDSRRGGVGRVESPGHPLDGMWLVFSTRHEGVYNFTDRLGDYNTDLSSVEPTTHNDGWPQYPAESRPVRAYSGWASVHSPLVRPEADSTVFGDDTRREPLTKRERAELQGYVSASASIGRAALFLIAITLVGVVSRRIQQGFFETSAPLWLIPTLLFGISLYRRASRWTGGGELRDLITRDLETNQALVHRIRVREAIVFAEQEDEGPIVFVLTETGKTAVFLGQDLARQLSRGFPWQAFDVRETAHSRRFLRLERIGDPFDRAETRPPLSRERYKELGLYAISRFARLHLPFERLRD